MAPKMTYEDGSTPKICIIGTGYGGTCVASRLKRDLGITSFTMIEKNQDVGGVWFSNTYPGAGCDIPSHFYQLSYFQKADWKSFYPPQKEIHQYIREVHKKFDLYPHIQFNTTVKSATWNESIQKWTVVTVCNETNNEEVLEFDIVVMCTGTFRQPNYPREFMSFKGPVFHSAEWDSNIRLENKVVGVVGGGASAIQVVPAIAKRTKELVVFQRSSSWIFPRIFEMRFFLMRILLTLLPFLVWVLRVCCYLGGEFFYATHRAGSLINYMSAVICKCYLYWNVKDWKLAKRLVPKYKYGYRAVFFSNKYHATFNLPNVRLNDNTITKVEDRTITTEDGQSKEVDVLVLCTGFRVQDWFAPIQVIGKNGVDILKMWKAERPRTYFGVCWHESPNLFFPLGPNGNPGHQSALFMIECQTQFILECIRAMLKRNAQTIQVKLSAQDEFMNEIIRKYKDVTWRHDEESPVQNWIYNEKGECTTFWPKTATNYWRKTRRIDPSKFNFKPRNARKYTKMENIV